MVIEWLKPGELLVLGYVSGMVSIYNLGLQEETEILNCGKEIERIYVLKNWPLEKLGVIAAVTESKTHFYHIESKTAQECINIYGCCLDDHTGLAILLGENKLFTMDTSYFASDYT